MIATIKCPVISDMMIVYRVTAPAAIKTVDCPMVTMRFKLNLYVNNKVCAASFSLVVFVTDLI